MTQGMPNDDQATQPALRLAGDATDALAREQWLRTVWAENRRWVAAILLAHKPRWVEVDDLLQEVAVSVVRKLADVRDPDAVRAWLRTVAVNAARAAARSPQRRQVASANEDLETQSNEPSWRQPWREGLIGEESSRLMQLAQRLADGYREPLLMKALHNMSYREIARVLSIPETTVETRIARARKQLREWAEEEARKIQKSAGQSHEAHPMN
jgi:RNA polymerase sigma factor (sigma-70 family)